MAFTVEKLDLYNRADVEDVLKVVAPYLAKKKEGNAELERTWIWWKHAKASAIGEIMRLHHDQIYRNEDWKILKDGKFVAWAYSREVNLSEHKATIYPVLGFLPLNYESADTISALETFIQKWINEGYKKFWLRVPVRAAFLNKVILPNVKITFIESYPKAGTGAPFPAKWDIYEIEGQQ